MKVAFQTLGCRVNVYDSEAMSEMFMKDGYELVDYAEEADVYVINTCTVTSMGDKKSRQFIKKAKRQNPDAVVAVVGCYSQVNKEEVAGIEGVDVVLGSRNKSEIVYYVNKAMVEKAQVIHVSDNILLSPKFEDLEISDYEGKTRAFLKIQDGCNRFCSYCIIPYARGGLSSKEPQKVLDEVRSLAEKGFKEIILSGIHIASYGQEFGKPVGLIDLMEELEDIEGIERVRIGSIEPMFFSGGAMDRIVRLRKLCPHFHLSLQSGCDATLKRMNRRYTAAEYAEVVHALRREIPGVSITTDVIVGFPEETVEEFGETMAFLERLELNKIHTFKYSPRKGTPAYRLKDPVDGVEKERRSSLVMALSDRCEAAYTERLVGKTVPVLFEEGKNGIVLGYTPDYIQVKVETDLPIRGSILQVAVTGHEKGLAFGRI